MSPKTSTLLLAVAVLCVVLSSAAGAYSRLSSKQQRQQRQKIDRLTRALEKYNKNAYKSKLSYGSIYRRFQERNMYDNYPRSSRYGDQQYLRNGPQQYYDDYSGSYGQRNNYITSGANRRRVPGGSWPTGGLSGSRYYDRSYDQGYNRMGSYMDSSRRFNPVIKNRYGNRGLPVDRYLNYDVTGRSNNMLYPDQGSYPTGSNLYF